MLNITSQHIKGFIAGIGVSALGFYVYKKNQRKIDDFLRRQGIHIPSQDTRDLNSMTLQELVTEKERLEDLIAEREHSLRQSAPSD